MSSLISVARSEWQVWMFVSASDIPVTCGQRLLCEDHVIVHCRTSEIDRVDNMRLGKNVNWCVVENVDVCECEFMFKHDRAL